MCLQAQQEEHRGVRQASPAASTSSLRAPEGRWPLPGQFPPPFPQPWGLASPLARVLEGLEHSTRPSTPGPQPGGTPLPGSGQPPDSAQDSGAACSGRGPGRPGLGKRSRSSASRKPGQPESEGPHSQGHLVGRWVGPSSGAGPCTPSEFRAPGAVEGQPR